MHDGWMFVSLLVGENVSSPPEVEPFKPAPSLTPVLIEKGSITCHD